MTAFQVPGTLFDANAHTSTAPLIVLFERDDAIAVPLLSQLRMAGYDVRAARTPVELFDITGKQLVALVLVDLGKATAGRREFWVALDAQRRGRPMQVMTFRYTPPTGLYDMDFEPTARAIADVEVHGAQEFQLIIEGVRQRVPLNGIAGGVAGLLPNPMQPFGQSVFQPMVQPGMPNMSGGIAPIGATLGVPSPFMYQQPVSPYPMLPQPQPQPYFQQPGISEPASAPVGTASPFAHPSSSNPFGLSPSAASAGLTSAAPADQSPFAQPYSNNPFATEAEVEMTANNSPVSAATETVHTFNYQAPSQPPMNAFEERAARLSEAYAAEFGISDPGTPAFSAGLPKGQAMDAWDTGGFFDSNARGLPQGGGADRFGPQTGSAPDHATAFSDTWTPPDGNFDWDAPTASTLAVANSRKPFDDGQKMDFTPTEYAPALDIQVGLPRNPARNAEVATLQTSPVPTPEHLPVMRKGTPTEQKLSSVLMEGALLSEQKLETLQGVQQMLNGINMNFKLGELAVLFKFLSPDQLLAAQLVSRGLVSPQRIASLGRTKQDLANSGMDFNLADLLIQFQIVPEEQLRSIQRELAL